MNMSKKIYWSFILYPSYSPKDWLHRLKASGLPFAVSPCHDKDLDIHGFYVIPHYHVIIVFPISTNYDFVDDFVNSFGSSRPYSIEYLKPYYNYFIHAYGSNFKYDPFHIICGNGFSFPV